MTYVRTLKTASAAAGVQTVRSSQRGPDTLIVSGLGSDKVVAVLGADAVPFSEVAAHRVSLEEAYLELTQEAVEYRTASGAA